MTMKAAPALLVLPLILFSTPAALAWQTGICTVVTECRSDARCEASLGKSVEVRLFDDGMSARLKTPDFKTVLTRTSGDKYGAEFEGRVGDSRLTANLLRSGDFAFTIQASGGVKLSTLAKCRKVAG